MNSKQTRAEILEEVQLGGYNYDFSGLEIIIFYKRLLKRTVLKVVLFVREYKSILDLPNLKYILFVSLLTIKNFATFG